MVNSTDEFALTPPQMLALAHAPRPLRAKLRWLMQFDQRLNGVVERAREPLIAQMRLAWWRETLAKAPADRPKGEPLLAAMAGIDGAEDLTKPALEMVDAAELSIGEGGAGRPAQRRLMAVFKAYCTWLDLQEADRKTAEMLLSLLSDGKIDVTASLPRSLRPLTILILAGQLERGETRAGAFGAGIRLSWHALTGR